MAVIIGICAFALIGVGIVATRSFMGEEATSEENAESAESTEQPDATSVELYAWDYEFDYDFYLKNMDVNEKGEAERIVELMLP